MSLRRFGIFGTHIAYVDRCRDGCDTSGVAIAITGIVSTVVKQGRRIESLNALVIKDDKFCKLSLESVVFAKSPRPLWMVNCGTDCGIVRDRAWQQYQYDTLLRIRKVAVRPQTPRLPMVDHERSALLFTTGEKTTMQVSGNFSLSGIDAVRSSSRANAITAAHSETKASLAMPVDQLELSAEAMALGETTSSSEVFRADKVASLREAIAAGNYDTDEKLDAALELMFQRFE